MADYQIGDKEFAKYEAWLQKEDKAMGTRLKYQRDVRSLQKWLRERAVNQELLNDWRAALKTCKSNGLNRNIYILERLVADW